MEYRSLVALLAAMALLVALQGLLYLLDVGAVPAYIAATGAACALYAKLRLAATHEPAPPGRRTP